MSRTALQSRQNIFNFSPKLPRFEPPTLSAIFAYNSRHRMAHVPPPAQLANVWLELLFQLGAQIFRIGFRGLPVAYFLLSGDALRVAHF